MEKEQTRHQNYIIGVKNAGLVKFIDVRMGGMKWEEVIMFLVPL
jgi:hypothetical protein